MRSHGIYTLANDVVYDQLVALLNSIEANVNPDIPICVIPYDDRLDKVKREIASRENVTLFDNWDAIQRWEDFANQVWAAHSRAKHTGKSKTAWYKGHLHRRLAAFEGYFEKFVFYDGDSLAMKPLDSVWEKLDTYDFVFDDWEHAKPSPVAALNIPIIEKTGIYKEADIRPKLHCASFFASKWGFFEPNELAILKERLIEQGEIEWINGRGWWDDAFLFNYMTLRCDRSLFNFTLSPDGKERTGNCANADPFVNIDNVLHNEQDLKPIHRIHYMSYSSSDFARLSRGEDVDIRYKDSFLYYRFMKQPDQKPKELKPPSTLIKTGRLLQKAVGKVKKIIS
ncbi:methionine synthase [Microcoleus sp. FACHB-831]|uniref:Npun_R2821/Npun_R2822 family protein n=1 Tax=Microcoleus sp. FACHB-831 TaxID=2692827 RepID=UPI001685EA81|nr:Npun_R2821/Npun_R2822 family protein [Microcoleus sp. FACHB-831]MBD1922294.1 methionine synthase [Microcoleus sp. FACHB-831]